MNNSPLDTETMPEPHPTVSGKAVVATMFAFGLLATSLIWFYWNKHIEPFMPLQLALAEKFEDSSPRVEGGQRKIHKETPKLLRITMRSPYDPTNSENEEQVNADIRQIVSISNEHLDMSAYSLLELHLYQPNPEKKLLKQEFLRSLPDLQPVDVQ